MKAHEWFEDFDWDLFFEKKMKPAFVPEKEELCTQKFVDEALLANAKNSFQTIMMIHSA